MEPGRLTLELFDLSVPLLDSPAALKEMLALWGSRQGVIIDTSADEGGRVFVGAGPFEVLRVIAGKAVRETARGRFAMEGNPYRALGRRIQSFRLDGRAASFLCGAVGNLDYEMARHLERLPLKNNSSSARLMLFDRMIAHDPRKAKTELAALIPRGDRAARRAAAGMAEKLSGLLRRASPAGKRRSVKIPDRLPEMNGVLGRENFLRGVRRLKEHIRAGDIFQGVLSERFELAVRTDPWTAYRALAFVEPSPYLFFIKDGAEYLIGASPERLIKAENGLALNCPIAGTRPRGDTPRRDRLLERSMRRSPKERAEHLMLVDLARNDLGRVCAPGSVKVREFMKVRRLSGVMHLVSEVEGRLNETSAWEALAASFPAGTVSGAPKIRAMELIAELESSPRGFYAGAVLQHDFSGNLDSCIAIRSMSIVRDHAVLQAGAGVVADSRPEKEYQEVLNKLLSLRRALALAESWSS